MPGPCRRSPVGSGRGPLRPPPCRWRPRRRPAPAAPTPGWCVRARRRRRRSARAMPPTPPR
eukprot:2374669-Pleurochrysis_carterae.AAC.1